MNRLLAAGIVLLATTASAQIPVRFNEGLVHGFLTLRSPDGVLIANGDLLQTARGDQVTTHLQFRFKDGSVQDETAVYSQRQYFHLISDRLVQKGPVFPQPLDMTIDGATGAVVVHYTDEHGEQKTESDHIDLPPDLANGLILTLMKNIRSAAPPKSLSYIAATPKPRLVKLDIAVAGREPFSSGSSRHDATHYVLKVDIGGLTGVVASLFGKEPPDSHLWILEGEAPAFVKAQQSFFLGGPIWQIELASPVWPRTAGGR